jgi:hypothetical protein
VADLRRTLPDRKPHDASVEIARPRILDAFEEFEKLPVRLLCAPKGGGKTTALRQYVAQRSGAVLITLPHNATREDVKGLLADAGTAGEIVVDEVDMASPDGLKAFFEEIDANRARGRRYVLAGSSRTRLQAQRLSSSGIAKLFDASFLAFTSTEIAEVAAAYGVSADGMDVEQLEFETDGWPLAVSWIIRDAARNGQSLSGAFEQWRDGNAHLLVELVALTQLGGKSAPAFMTAIRSAGEPVSQRMLEELDAEGYPIVRMRTCLRPYRVLVRLADDTVKTAVAPGRGDQLVLKMFGRFSCAIRNREVVFARRRDKTLLTFVALAPGASVSRAELLEAFWPDTPPALASQSLRTTLSRLRSAIANAAGSNADRYLCCEGRIALNLDRVSIDARRFAEHIECAELEELRGKLDIAREHYLQADRLYADTLLGSEALEPALVPRVVDCAALMEIVLSRLIEIYAQGNDMVKGRAYTRRLATVKLANASAANAREANARLMSSINIA